MPSVMTSSLLSLAFAAALSSHAVQPVFAIPSPQDSAPSSFLGPKSDTAREVARTKRRTELRHLLIDHLSLLLIGLNEDSSRLARAVAETEKVLSPIVAASPKNKYENLDDEAARYALHRLFMEKHGWHFSIFDASSGASSSNSSNASSIFSFQGHLPPDVVEVLERQFKRHHGYGVLELALFAASVEHVIFAEIPDRLASAYLSRGVGFDGVVTYSTVKQLIDLHMGAYISNRDLSNTKPVDAFMLVTNMQYNFYDWTDTRAFFRGIEASLETDSGEYTFADVARIALQIEKEFVHLSNRQCLDLKERLQRMETQSSGRVRLLDFYNSALYNGSDAFVESTEYLRELGDLDESDPLEPRLIISNYIDGPNNCVAMTSFYQVCCVDECADLYSHLEMSLGKPEASPAEILPVVQSLASPSMDSCRSVADTLERRLQDIANNNHGVVAIHGPEFAEWMHFVYPRECTRASTFGLARSLTADEWQDRHPFVKIASSKHDLQEYSAHLADLERAKSRADPRMRPGAIEWDVAASASWTLPEESVATEWESSHVRTFTGAQATSLVGIFAAVASLPVLVLKMAADRKGMPSSEFTKSRLSSSDFI